LADLEASMGKELERLCQPIDDEDLKDTEDVDEDW